MPNPLKTPLHLALTACVYLSSTQFAAPTAPTLQMSTYRGWNTQCLRNEWVEVHVVPEIGGRVVQFKVGKKEFLWVNPDLAGKYPTASGLTPEGGWLNYGGDKLWPAPQGWENAEQWPGPPDAVLDGQPYRVERLPAEPGEAALKLTSGEDQRSGIQFSRVIRIFENSTRVQFEGTMKNIDSRPRRWGIWAHTQLDAAAGTRPNQRLKSWCAVNPRSRFARGYDVIFGAKENPAFHTDWRRGVVQADYRYQVGKIGVDSPAGWVATVDGRQGATFVQRFMFEPDRPYPDNASVEFWHNGVGQIHAYNRDMDFPDDPRQNPFVAESEVLSPFFELQPGQSRTWHYEWQAANVGGDYPVVEGNNAGIVAEPLKTVAVKPGSLTAVKITGRFGVFAPGKAELRFVDVGGAVLGRTALEPEASPLKALVLRETLRVPSGASAVELVVLPQATQRAQRIARQELKPQLVAGQWTPEQAWDWYEDQPWLIGCNFLPSTAVNAIEMWQADTFDPAAIARELGWAKKLGFNTVRVFLNYVVWKNDAAGLKRRFAEFLALADRHGLAVMPILFDDCNFAERVAAAGPQPEPVPGVHNSQWVSSPPLSMVTNRAVWPELERYAKDILGAFGRDRRVILWDLYNEPGNSEMGDRSLPLVEAVFGWARAAKPRQPLTMGPWADFSSPMSRRMMELSDVVSFHSYDTLPGLQAKLDISRRQNRPILCTEWLHRQRGNAVEAILPIFLAQRIGCWNWGLVYGRTQTYMPWGSKPHDAAPALWQHDLLHPDGRAFRIEELDLIQKLVDASKTQGSRRTKPRH